MHNIATSTALLRHIRKANEFVQWLRTDGERLVASAHLLGGAKWARRALAIVNAARAGQDLIGRINALASLHKLLHLEFASSVESFEGWCFAQVQPDDPRADVARLCAEALDRGLRAINALRAAGYRQVGGLV